MNRSYGIKKDSKRKAEESGTSPYVFDFGFFLCYKLFSDYTNEKREGSHLNIRHF
jgi:hypothetical protein